jgi:hypothetical protein
MAAPATLAASDRQVQFIVADGEYPIVGLDLSRHL